MQTKKIKSDSEFSPKSGIVRGVIDETPTTGYSEYKQEYNDVSLTVIGNTAQSIASIEINPEDGLTLTGNTLVTGNLSADQLQINGNPLAKVSETGNYSDLSGTPNLNNIAYYNSQQTWTKTQNFGNIVVSQNPSPTINGLPTPVDPTDAVTKSYVDIAIENNSVTQWSSIKSYTFNSLVIAPTTGNILRCIVPKSTPKSIPVPLEWLSVDGTLLVDDFGADPTGKTNSTNAIISIGKAIRENNGGATLKFSPNGNYAVGLQSINPNHPTSGNETPTTPIVGNQSFYVPVTDFGGILTLVNCTKPIIIEGNGASISMVNTVFYGSFSPITGAPFSASTSAFPVFEYPNYAAGPGDILLLEYNSDVVVRDLNINGNISNAFIGGRYGDTGIQIAFCGMQAMGNQNLLVENVKFSQCGLDGIVYAGNYQTTDNVANAKGTFINCSSDGNGRQGISWVGGEGLTMINCSLTNTGQTINVNSGLKFGSSPMAGIDIEPDYVPSYNGVFTNCKFSNNVNYGITSYINSALLVPTRPSNISFYNCEIDSDTAAGPSQVYGAIYHFTPYDITYENCTVRGTVVNSNHGQPTQNISGDCVFNNCKLTLQGSEVFNFSQLSNSSFNNCNLYDTRTITTSPILVDSSSTTFTNLVATSTSTATTTLLGTYLGNSSIVTSGYNQVNKTGLIVTGSSFENYGNLLLNTTTYNEGILIWSNTKSYTVNNLQISPYSGNICKCIVTNSTIGSFLPSEWLSEGDVLNIIDFGAKGDGVTDNTSVISACITACSQIFRGGQVYIPAANGSYMVHKMAFNLSNVFIYGDGLNSALQMIDRTNPTLYPYSGSGIITFYSSSNASYCGYLKFINFTLIGDSSTVNTYNPSTDQFQHLISLNGVSNVLIESTSLRGMAGDGIYLGYGQLGVDSRNNINIKIRNNTIDGLNYKNRNGISVVSGSNIIIEENSFLNISDPSMPGPIDIEPDDSPITLSVNNVTVVKNTFYSTNGANGCISVISPPGLTNPTQSITIESNINLTNKPTILFDIIANINNDFKVLHNRGLQASVCVTSSSSTHCINNILLDGNTGLGIILGSAPLSQINNAIIKNNFLTGTSNVLGQAIQLRSANNILIDSNTINEFATGVVSGASGSSSSFIKISNNTFSNIGGTTAESLGTHLPYSNIYINNSEIISEPNLFAAFLTDNCGNIVNNNAAIITFSLSTLPNQFPHGTSRARISLEPTAPTNTTGVLITTNFGNIGNVFQNYYPVINSSLSYNRYSISSTQWSQWTSAITSWNNITIYVLNNVVVSPVSGNIVRCIAASSTLGQFVHTEWSPAVDYDGDSIQKNSLGLLSSASIVKATTPTPANDITQGYIIGTIWTNTVGPNLYVCTDNTKSSAVWIKLI